MVGIGSGSPLGYNQAAQFSYSPIERIPRLQAVVEVECRSMETKNLLDRLANGERFAAIECDQIFAQMLEGKFSQAEIAAFLIGWRMCGESAVELSAGARAMRARSVKLDFPAHLRPISDNCGTGGDGQSTFNISTAAAIVVGALGVRIAKHGNRAVSSKCGSADLLFAAGFPETFSPQQSVDLFFKTGFTFFFAPHFHPALAAIMPVRKSLGIRTVFNLLGPLANPISPDVQIIGVGAPQYLRPMALAAQSLGIGRALIVHSRDGLDEISPAALTDCVLVDDTELTTLVINPAEVGVKHSLKSIQGGDSSQNLDILKSLLNYQLIPTVDTTALNAGALLYLANRCPDWQSGFELAKSEIASKKAKIYFNEWLKQAKVTATKNLTN